MSLLAHNIAKCGQNVTFEDRGSKIINGQASEIFENPRIRKVIVKTVSGVTTFDDTNTERIVTHKLIMNYEAGIGSEQWVKIGTKRLKILPAENCGEQDKVLILLCTERGDNSKVVNSA